METKILMKIKKKDKREQEEEVWMTISIRNRMKKKEIQIITRSNMRKENHDEKGRRRKEPSIFPKPHDQSTLFTHMQNLEHVLPYI